MTAQPTATAPHQVAPRPAPPVAVVAGSPRVVAGVVAAAAVVYATAPRLVSLVNHALPAAARVRSRGTKFPTFLVAEPFAIRSTAIVLAAAVLVGFAAARVRVRVRPTPRARLVAITLVVLAAAAVYRWFGYPHNASSANSYYHWLDNTYFSRAHMWWYVLPKPFHRLFYDRPYLLQSLNGALNAALMYAIGRTLFRRGLIPVAMASAALISSLLLTFADTGEDVQLTVAALLFASLALLRRWTPWTGVALFVVLLARPPLAYIWVAWAATEFLVVDDPTVRGVKARARNLLHDRFVTINASLAFGLFVLWDVILVVRGESWLFHDGRLIDNGLDIVKPITTDGFRISVFSGAYLLHALWVFPSIWLVALVVALWRRRELPLLAKRALAFCVLTVIGGIVVSESQPLFYYNVRYLSYLLPFVLIGAFTVLLLPARPRQWLGRSAVVTLLLLAGTTTYWRAFDQHRALERSAIAETFDDRFELRRIVGDATVSSAGSKQSTLDYIAYIFRRPWPAIPVIGSGRRVPVGYIFVSSRRPPNGRVVWRGSSLVLVHVPAPGTRMPERR